MSYLAANRLMATLAASLLAAGAALADVAVTLEADDKAGAARPFCAGRVTIDPNDIADCLSVRAMWLRPERGGPAIILPVAVTPGTSTQLSVALPATSIEQTYRIQLLEADDPEAAVVAESRASITWPVEDVRPEAFLDPDTYRKWEFALPAWQAGTIRNVFLAAVLIVLVTAGVLLLPWGALRALALGLIVVVGSCSMWAILHNADLVVERTDGDITVLACRRTTVWHSNDANWCPLYYDAGQMEHQTVLIRPTRAISVQLQPGRVQLLKRLPT